MQFDYTYFENQRKKRFPLFLQLGFLAIGALLIIAFTLLYSDSPNQADALLFSPISQAKEENLKKDYSYKLLYADPKKIIYKETSSDNQVIKLVNLSTNLTVNIASGKRLGSIGFLDETTFLFLDDEEGLGKFTVKKYDITDKTTESFIAFSGPKTVSSGKLDNLVSVSPDKTKLAVTHESGLVLYTLKNENEETILENSAVSDCNQSQNCLSYEEPLWITNSQLLINQLAINNLTLLIVDLKGTILAVLPANIADLDASINGFPLVGQTGNGLYLVEPKKTTPVLTNNQVKYSLPRWLGTSIVAITQSSELPTLIKTDKTGKKLVTLAEFSTTDNVSDLITDPKHENMYFLNVRKDNSNIGVVFYQMNVKEDKPSSVYSISKNL